MKRKSIVLFTALLLLSSFSTWAQDNEQYEQRLNALIDNGVINQDEAKKKLLELKTAKQVEFHNQVRGVASKIQETKIIKIVNDPLVIP